MLFTRALILTVMTTPALAAGSLSPVEQAIVKHADAHNREALALLERVVNINSGTLNLAGVRAVGDVFRGELDALGFTTRWEDGAPYQHAEVEYIRRVTGKETAK